MRPFGTVTTLMLVATSAFGLACSATAAQATTKEDVAINGKFRATSIGNLAKINYQFNNEPTVVSTWTISSSCENFDDCAGTLTSDQGWNAPIRTTDGTMWYARHDVPNWEKCQDGTAFTGEQTFYFYPADPGGNGSVTIGSPVFAGKDKTVGPSGACGQNAQLLIVLPLRLDRIS